MLNQHELQKLMEDKAKVFGSDGEKIGTLGQIYLDDETGSPNFATVHTGFFGTAENFVPLDQADISEGALYVQYPKDFVKDAPNLDPAVHLSETEEAQLYSYYDQAGSDPTAHGVGPDLVEGTSPFTSGERVVRDDFASSRPRLRKYTVSERSGDETVEPIVGWSPQSVAAESDFDATPDDPESTRPGRTDRLDP